MIDDISIKNYAFLMTLRNISQKNLYDISINIIIVVYDM